MSIQDLNDDIDSLIQQHYDYIYKYEKRMGIVHNEVDCKRCHGKGVISKYKHVELGICFVCRGSGKS